MKQLLLTILFCSLAATGLAQVQPAPSREATLSGVAELPLDSMERLAYSTAMQNRDYTRAATILVEAINREMAADPKSKRAAQLLLAVADVFFLNGEWLNVVISFKKAEVIQPLAERQRFTLAMAYIRLARTDWARSELAKLAEQFPANALYLYWLGRLDYDARQYQSAISKFEKVIKLDPQMMRAYDNLGLCYDYLGQYDEAVKHYNLATELNRKQPQPSPWPHLNLAITLLAQNKINEAEASIREALRYDSRLPQTHYQLGLTLEKQGKIEDAIQSQEQAAQLDTAYPEPHYALSRLYQKQGDRSKAEQALAKFQQLKEAQRQPK